MKTSFIVGGLLIAIFVAVGSVGLMKSITPYVTVTEAKKATSTVQVKGALLKNKIGYDKSGSLLFSIRGDDGQEMKVVTQKPKPDNFIHATDVVVIGKYGDGIFHAESLIVKCPSKYQGAKPEGTSG